jgi:hypothetical protein
MALPEDIVAKVRQDFGEDDGLLVLQELKNLHGEGDNDFGDRILRSIVALANGSLKKFDQAIELTRNDWRDTLVAAEGWACNALLMTYPFPLHLDQDLCRRWVIGQEVHLPWITDGAAPWEIQAADIREFELRRLQREELADGDALTIDVFVATIRMLCARGQWISSSPAFEIWLVVWYSIDHETKAFALRRMKYNPSEIKQRGKWD